MKVVKRTFAAKKFPKGSPERTALNENAVTSEYLPSYRYVLREEDGGKTPYTYRTKAEAVAAAERLAK